MVKWARKWIRHFLSLAFEKRSYKRGFQVELIFLSLPLLNEFIITGRINSNQQGSPFTHNEHVHGLTLKNIGHCASSPFAQALNITHMSFATDQCNTRKTVQLDTKFFIRHAMQVSDKCASLRGEALTPRSVWKHVSLSPRRCAGSYWLRHDLGW